MRTSFFVSGPCGGQIKGVYHSCSPFWRQDKLRPLAEILIGSLVVIVGEIRHHSFTQCYITTEIKLHIKQPCLSQLGTVVLVGTENQTLGVKRHSRGVWHTSLLTCGSFNSRALALTVKVAVSASCHICVFCSFCVEANHPSCPCQRNIQLPAFITLRRSDVVLGGKSRSRQLLVDIYDWWISSDRLGAIGEKRRESIVTLIVAWRLHCVLRQTPTHTPKTECNFLVTIWTHWFIASAAVSWSNAWHACCRVLLHVCVSQETSHQWNTCTWLLMWCFPPEFPLASSWVHLLVRFLPVMAGNPALGKPWSLTNPQITSAYISCCCCCVFSPPNIALIWILTLP